MGLLTIELYVPGITSLKEKRGVVKPLIARLRKEFNVSVAEVGDNEPGSVMPCWEWRASRQALTMRINCRSGGGRRRQLAAEPKSCELPDFNFCHRIERKCNETY